MISTTRDRSVDKVPAIAFVGVCHGFCKNDQGSIARQSAQRFAEIEPMEKDTKGTPEKESEVCGVPRNEERRSASHSAVSLRPRSRAQPEQSDLALRAQEVWYQLPPAYRALRKLQAREHVVRSGRGNVGGETEEVND